MTLTGLGIITQTDMGFVTIFFCVSWVWLYTIFLHKLVCGMTVFSNIKTPSHSTLNPCHMTETDFIWLCYIGIFVVFLGSIFWHSILKYFTPVLIKEHVNIMSLKNFLGRECHLYIIDVKLKLLRFTYSLFKMDLSTIQKQLS